MTDDPDEYEARLRFSLGVFFKHPTMRAEEFTAAMGREPEWSWNVGEQRTSRRGEPIPGIRKETYWYSTEVVRGKRHFFDELAALLTSLEGLTGFVHAVVSSGGRAWIKLALHGGHNIGDMLSAGQIRQLAASGLELGLEVFPTMQHEWD